MHKYNMDVDEDVLRRMPICKRISFDKFINEENEHLVTLEGLDLLTKMLVYDHEQWITVREALLHPFFDCFKR